MKKHELISLILVWTSTASLAISNNDLLPSLKPIAEVSEGTFGQSTTSIDSDSVFPSQSLSPSSEWSTMPSTNMRSMSPSQNPSLRPTLSVLSPKIPEQSFGSIVLDHPQQSSSDDSAGILGGTLAGAVGVALLSLFILKRRKRNSPREVQVFEIPDDSDLIESPLEDSHHSDEGDQLPQQSLSTIEEEDSQVDIYPVSSSEEMPVAQQPSYGRAATAEGEIQAKRVHFTHPYQMSSSEGEDDATGGPGEQTIRIDSDPAFVSWPISLPLFLSSTNEVGGTDEDHSSTKSTNSKTELLPKGESVTSDSFYERHSTSGGHDIPAGSLKSKFKARKSRKFALKHSPCKSDEGAILDAQESCEMDGKSSGMVEI